VKCKLYNSKLVCWVLVSYVELEQSDTNLHLNYESYVDHCISGHIHPLILTLNYLSADGQ
jgi:hypothetical protein